MGKVNILVVEDDPLHLSKIELMIDEMGYQFGGHASTANEALRLVRAIAPDVILMDIQISGDTDGISLAGQINKIATIPIIYTTAFQDANTIQKAVATEPHAYLTKPISKADLQAAIELVIYNSDKPLDRPHRDSDWQEDVIMKDSFFVKLSDRLEKVQFQEVMWIETAEEEKYVNMHIDGGSLKIRTSLKKIQSQLPNTFIRINSSQLINGERIRHISDVNNTVNINGHDLHMSRKYKKSILSLLNFIN